MREPLAWAGGAVLLGATLWPHVNAPVWLLGFGLGLASLAGLWGRGAALWLVGAVLAGALACATQQTPPALQDTRAVRATLLRASGGQALLSTQEGHYLANFEDDPPEPGARLAALLRPRSRSPPPPGEPDPQVQARRSAATPASVDRWVRLGPAPSARVPITGVPHAGLLEALVTGQKDGIPADDLALLRRTGTAHLLAVSGMNVAMVAGACAGLAALLARPLTLLPWPWLARLPPLLVGLLAALRYAEIAGWPVSTVRAVWMVAAGLAARALGLSVRPWNLLGLAATAVVLPDPGQVGELGFQLSFGAVAGMLWIVPRFTRLLPPDTPRPLVWLVGSLGATLGATAGTLPVVCWRFQELSPVSPLTNLVAGPLLGGGALTGALLSELLPGALGRLCLRLADTCAGLGLGALRALDCEPWHPATGPVGAVLLLAALPLRRHPALAAGLAIVALGLRRWPLVPTAMMLSVGQGDAAALRWPDGSVWLIDGGPPGQQVLRWLRRERISKIEAVFLSHPDADHLGGLLPVAAALELGAVYLPSLPRPDQPMFEDLVRTLRERDVPVRLPGDALPHGATLLHPDAAWLARNLGRSDNNDGLVLQVEMGGSLALFPGDIEAEAEAWLAPRLRPVALLKVPHHGSRSSSTPALVAATDPALVVVSVGVDNPYGHPAAEVLEIWSGHELVRTDLQGTIQVGFPSDGPRILTFD